MRAYVSARVDLAKLSARRALLGVANWALAVLLASGLCLTAIVFLFYGVAEGLGQWLQRPWLGYLVTGASLLLLLAITVMVVARQRRSESKRLRKEADQATENFKEAMKTLAPLEWTREHPWTSTGAAAAAGFVVAGAVTASQPGTSRFRPGAGDVHEPAKAVPPNEPSFILSALVSTTMSILKGALTPIVMDFVKELHLSEIFGVNLERRAQDGQNDGPEQQPDHPENGQPAENA